MFRSKLYFISLNTRGLKDNTKRKALFLFCKGQKAQCIFFQETHSNEEDRTFWRNQWGDTMLLSHGTNRSAGVAICFNNCPGKVIEHKTDNEGHWILVILNIEGTFWILINVYGYNVEVKNRLLFDDISNNIRELKKKYSTDNLLVGGDFNFVPDEWMDRFPTKYTTHEFNPLFSNFCNNNSLYDIWRHLNTNVRQFSWIRPNGNNKSRIDLWLATQNILKHISYADLSAAPVTDHSIVSITLDPETETNYRQKYWKFNANYLKDPQYCDIVKKKLTSIKTNNSICSSGGKWEFFKYKIRKFSIQYGIEKSRKQRETERKLISNLNECCKAVTLSDTNKEKIFHLQSKLDELYLNKAKGAFKRGQMDRRWKKK